MSASLEPPRRGFRWRLTIAFVLVAGLSSGILAVSSFLLVRDDRLDNFLERSFNDAEVHYFTATSLGPDDRSGLESLMHRAERRGAEAVILRSGDVLSTDPLFDEDAVPEDIRSGDRSEQEFPHADETIAGDPYLVVATPQVAPDFQLYFFYPRAGLENGLADLAGVLLRVWAVLVAASALIGNILARRTLRPVARASGAARSLAEGLLDTRLPVETHDEFGAWAVSFNEMAEALQEKIMQLTRARERESRFTSDVSHELRTPLTALMGSASMLAEKLDDMTPEARWAAERVIQETRRLRALVDELLEISRLHAGRESMTLEPTDLKLLVEAVIDSRRWGDEVQLHAEPVRLSTDRRRVERIVANLVSNAVTHGRKDVRVRIRAIDDEAVVEVSDRGEGIPPEHVEHLFERFYKVDPSRPGGSGLGLSIAQANAYLLSGSIELDNEYGQGCRFILRLPLHGAQTNGLPEPAPSLLTRDR